MCGGKQHIFPQNYLVFLVSPLTMNLHSIINPGDSGGFGSATVPESHPNLWNAAVLASGRSAQPNTMSPFADYYSPRHPGGAQDKRKVRPKGKVNTVYRAKPHLANGTTTALASRGGVPASRGRQRAQKHDATGSIGKRSRPSSHQSSSAAASQLAVKTSQIRAQAIADLYSVAHDHRVSIMDVVLDSKLARPDSRPGITEELMDVLEERQRIALRDPTDEEILQEMFNPWWHGRRQARKWRSTLVTPVDCSSSRIYRVSAERSTVSWDSTLDSEESLSSTHGPEVP